MINLISNGFYWEVLQKVLANISSEFKINYACNIYYQTPISKFKAKEIDWIDYDRLLEIKKYPADPNTLIPLDEELIRAMSECERLVLKMIDRKEQARRYSYQERKEMYYYYLRYWNHIIETKKINLFLTANIPHEVFDFVAYELCRLKKIPTILLYNESQTGDTVLIMNDWRESCRELPVHYSELKKKYAKSPIDEIRLNKQFEQYFLDRTSENPDKIFYMKKDFQVYTKIKGVATTIKRIFDTFKKQPFFALHFAAKVLLKKIKDIYFNRYYSSRAVKPDMKAPYVYLALQYQPELTTSPIADAFVDQLLIAQMLSKHLPKDVKIYVKEHPVQSSYGRTLSFYRDLLATDRIVLIKKNFDSRELIKHSKAVATATGTVGWEAMCRLKPVLMFGNYTYQYYDGVYQVKTNNDCISAVRKIFVEKEQTNLKGLKIFLRAFEDVSVRGTVDPDYLKVSKILENENIDNLTKACLTKIKLALK